MKIGVISLGCAKNLVDTENVLGLLRQSNQEIVTSYDDADAIIVNTCGFIDAAKSEAEKSKETHRYGVSCEKI